MKAFDDELVNISMKDIERMISTDLMNSVGDMLNEAQVSVGTVHFTLAYMIAEEIGDRADPREVAVGILSMQQYIYQIAMGVHREKHRKQEH